MIDNPGYMADWVWMPHPGHFICARDCRFHLNTFVGKHIVSTVGEYLPDIEVREILAKSRGIKLTGMGDERRYSWLRQVGYENIGYDRKYETMVFLAKPNDEEVDSCCPWVVSDYSELDFAGYKTAKDAVNGHMQLCRKWSMTEYEPDRGN